MGVRGQDVPRRLAGGASGPPHTGRSGLQPGLRRCENQEVLCGLKPAATRAGKPTDRCRGERLLALGDQKVALT